MYLQSLHRLREPWVMRRTADELVAYSMDCLEAHRIVRFSLQLLAQAKHVCIDGARGGIVVVTPYLAEQLDSGDDPVLVVQEEAQHLELLPGKRHQLSLSVQLHFGEVYFYVVEAEYFDIDCGLVQAPECGSHAR